MTKPKILHRERIYIPVDHISSDQFEAIENRFSKQLFAESNCAKCEYIEYRPSETCDSCPANLGEFKLHISKKFKDIEHVGIPQGAHKFLSKTFDLDQFQVIDKRPRKKFKYEIEFTGKLYQYQDEAVTSLINHYENNGGCGTLTAPPRSGKTIIGTAFICKLRLKTLILAKQVDWLHQFYETMCGSESQDPLTNIPDIEKFQQKKIIGICKKLEDFKKYDICLATYQTFLSDKGQLKYKELRDEFSIIVIDETHGVGAKEFSRTLNGFNSFIRLGLTATFDRKDGLHWLVANIAGAPFHAVEVETLKPQVEVILTNFAAKLPKSWTFALRNITKDKERNKLILKHVMRDIEEGRSIVIPTVFVKHAKQLVNAINKRAGETVAVAFTGASDRRDIILGARDGKYKVVVGTRSIIQTGINIPRWDCLYEIVPSSNIPNVRQRLARILTPVPGKPTPIIKYFLDETNLSKKCFSSEFYHGVVPFIKPIVSSHTRMVIKEYLSGRAGKNAKDRIEGEF